jgi:hypothetical protein
VPAELRALLTTGAHDVNPRAHQQAQDRAALAAVLRGDDARSPRGAGNDRHHHAHVHPGTLRVPTMPRSGSGHRWVTGPYSRILLISG